MRSVSKFSLFPIAVVLGAVLMAPGFLTAQSRSACGCSDIPFLINWLNAINAGIDAVQQFGQTANLSAYTNQIAPAPNPPRATYHEILNRAVVAAMSAYFTDPGASGRNACFTEVTNQFDSVSRSVLPAGTARTMREHIDLARIAYTRAANDILQRLSSMPRSCRPGDWFGSITVVETHQYDVSDTVPPQGRTNLGTVTVSRTSTSRSGTIRLSGNSTNASSSWTAGGNDTLSVVSKNLVRCEGGALQGAKVPDRTTTGSLSRSISRTGSGSSVTEVGIGESDGGRHFSVSFEIPAIDFTESGTSTSTSSGGCPGSEFNKTDNINAVKGTLAAQSVSVTVPYFHGNPEKIGGTELINLTPPRVSADVTSLSTIRVTVNLYKIRR